MCNVTSTNPTNIHTLLQAEEASKSESHLFHSKSNTRVVLVKIFNEFKNHVPLPATTRLTASSQYTTTQSIYMQNCFTHATIPKPHI
mmetsp:Transcript_2907/g.4648  ORF Transcript_2907/g.4648 Transcript_2907/m.4648 type:complete len:87 (-) Transcript_2907:110-370(-)